MNDTSISPATLLANVINKTDIGSMWLISGERQVGKTTWCSISAHQAKIAGWKVGGLITPAIFSGGEKIGFDIMDIQSGVQHHLGIAGDNHPDWIKIGMWCLDPKALSWANQQLKKCSGWDLLILDELGPLEFNENRGFQEGMRILDEKLVSAAFVVIRPELIPQAQKRWPEARVIEIRKEFIDPIQTSLEWSRFHAES